MKDWCTGFPETFKDIYIGDCCKKHDKTCSTRDFYVCLKNKIGKFHATWIAMGGSIGCWIKYTKLMIDKMRNK